MMKLLKSERAWKRWINSEGMQYQDDKQEPPTAYPCFAYSVLQSFAYEEKAAEYLYVADIERMRFELIKAAKTSC